MMPEEPFCLARIKSRLTRINGDDDITDAQEKRFIVDVAACLVHLHGVVDSRFTAIEGKMESLSTRGCFVERRKYNRKDSDTFKDALHWVWRNLAPDLIKLVILAIIAWLAKLNGLLG